MYSESVLGFSSGGCATSEQKSYLYKTETSKNFTGTWLNDEIDASATDGLKKTIKVWGANELRNLDWNESLLLVTPKRPNEIKKQLKELGIEKYYCLSDMIVGNWKSILEKVKATEI